ncbi:DUF397 domain-containing protein [Kitasatospora misakiensis]|uniref:DUF397 domain-containing protein n=1 Tax=Kitasatospora misakiensis TaxID=67330 RepID=A0ABW0XD43_9ACTN
MSTDEWQKSSYSAANNECVEVRAVAKGLEFRESDDPDAIVLAPLVAFAGLLDAIKAGDLDRFG